MKSTKYLIISLLFLAVKTNAQITRGNWLVGGTGNFSSYENTFSNNGTEVINKGIGINISPNVGYFFVDKFVAGTNISIGYSKIKNYEDNFGYGIGPFARYYLLKEDKQINFLVQASYTFSASSGDSKSKYSGYGFKAGPVIFFNSSVALEITLDYNTAKLIPNSLADSSYKNLQIGLGFQIHLEK